MDEDALRIIDLLNRAAGHLEEKGFENARLEVERLLGHVLGLDRVRLYVEFERTVEDGELERFRELYRRRLDHEPLQHLIGSTGFRDLELKTDRRAFIPRPETELLVECAVDFLRGRPNPVVADLGTGTGAIAVSVVCEVPGSCAVAVDISDDALHLARSNADRMGVADAIELVSADMLEGLAGRGPFDAVLSNPPYIPANDIPGLEPEVRDHDPHTALDGGDDGCSFLFAIADHAYEYLKPGGLLLLECEGDQAPATAARLKATGQYRDITVLKDLAGRDRLVQGQRPL